LKGIVGVGYGINHSRSTIKKGTGILHFSFSGSGSKQKYFSIAIIYLICGAELGSGIIQPHPPPPPLCLSPFSLQKLIEQADDTFQGQHSIFILQGSLVFDTIPILKTCRLCLVRMHAHILGK
jgi:hypothetical protein